MTKTLPPGAAQTSVTPSSPRGTASAGYTRFTVWIVLALGLMITAALTVRMKSSVEEIARQGFISHCREIQSKVTERLNDHARILQSGAALFDVSDVVTREKWRIFNKQQKMEQQLPGIQGMGFSLLIPRGELTRHIQQIRREGFPDYTLRPGGDREVYSSIIYLEPFSGRNLRAFGYDMFSEAVRRNAMELARDTGAAALSGKVILVQETDKEVQAGTLMYVPVYRKGMAHETVEQRRAAIQGWVYSPYRMSDLMRGILGDDGGDKSGQHNLQVFDGTTPLPQHLLYESHRAGDGTGRGKERFAGQVPVDFGGARWTLRFTHPGGGFFTSEYAPVWRTMVGGALITLLLFALIRVLTNARAAAQRLAEKLTGELRESEEGYRNQFANNSAAMLLIDPADEAILEANAAAIRFYGYSREQLLALRITDISVLSASEVRQALASATPEQGGRFDNRHRLADGSARDVEVSASSILIESGRRTVIHAIIHDVTDRKRAEGEIARQSGLITSLLDSIPDIIFFKDLHGVYLGCNPPFAEFVGRPREGIIGRTDYDLFDRQTADSFRDHDQRMLELCQSRHNEEWITFPDGRKMLIDTLKTPYRAPDGTLIGVLGVSRDTTDRKEAEENLRHAADRLSLATQAGGVGIWDYDVLNNHIVWDDQMFGLYGIAPDQSGLAYGAWQAGVHPEDRSESDALFRAALRGEGEFDTEFRVNWPDGSVHTIRALAMVQRDATGLPLHMIGTNWDITTEKQAEAALQESEDKIHLLLDSVAEAIYGIDMDGNCTFCNSACLRLLGYKHADDLLGKNMHWQIHPKYPDGTPFPVEKCRIFRAFHDGEGTHVDDEVLWRSDNSSFPAEYWSYPLIRDGVLSGAVVTFLDITERKEAEAQLLKTNRQLEEATERANDMASQAEAANVAKSEFLANMSHEIRTPMNGVIGMTGLLLDTGLNPDQRRYVETVRASGESLMALINDILDFSKIEAGKLEMETMDFDLRSLLDDFAAMMALRAHDKGLEFICAAAPQVPAYLRGDPGRLRQILTNLTGNAVKFTEEGEIAVRASLLSETDDEAMVRFSIKDTGIGIPAGKQGLLFRKFTQADASTTRKYGGTGLGLAISKQLAGLMGGEIGVISEEGLGSEFWFTARFARQPKGEHNADMHAGISGVRMLLVDDNATNREVLTAQLRAWGVRSEEASDGPTALQAIYLAKDADDPFLLAILDMQMPGMDGVALARAIKADERLKDTRLVLLSSLGQRGDTKKMADIGFSAYLTKPARQVELFDCLCAVLGGEAVTEETQPIVTRHRVREMRRGSVRILLAEDNITNQQVAVGILTNLGLRVEAVANGAEALKALEILPYDLVLMDVQMPVMDGLEATRRIRSDTSRVRNHHIPVIAMTAHAMQGDRERCLEAGMNDYVTKPVVLRALIEALEKWLPKEAVLTTERVPGQLSAMVPAAGGPETPVFNRPGMMARLMDDEDLAHTVIQGFLEDIPKQIEALRGYLESGDTGNVERQAHTIKGASGNLCGEALRAVAFEMEKAGKTGNLEAARANMPEIMTQFDLLKQAMTAQV